MNRWLLRFLTAFAWIGLVGVPAPASAAPAPGTTFVDTIGVCTHLDVPDSSYRDTAEVRRQLRFIGVRHVRERAPTSAGLGPYAAVAAGGVRFNFIVMDELPERLKAIETLSDHVEAVEGPNEVNQTPVSFNGASGPQAVIAMQKALFAAVRASHALNKDGKRTPVLTFTLAQGSDDYAPFGDMSPYTAFRNVHAYGQSAAPPYLMLPASIAAVTNAPNRPVIVTETGNHTLLDNKHGVSEAVQAKYILNSLLDDFRNGVVRTYIYQLQDAFPDQPGEHNPENHWGLYRVDLTPKPSAVALHNLTTILSGSAAPTGPAAEPVVTNLPRTGFVQLLAKPDGARELVLWAEPPVWDAADGRDIPVPPATVHVAFGQQEKRVEVFDPLVGTTPVGRSANTDGTDVSLTDHPIILRFGAGSRD